MDDLTAMRNKTLAAIWMVVGALAVLWIGMIPIVLIGALVGRFTGSHSPIVTMFILPPTLIIPACGATWFKHLFYKGMLWGYRPDKGS
jgi:hypothetical protein